MVQEWGYLSVGFLFGFVSMIGLVGLLVVAPPIVAPPVDPSKGETIQERQGTTK
jgi:hypothetical protein